MQLFLNATSPFARLARAIALEKRLSDRLELVWCDPWSNDAALLAAHTQGRIPVLVTDSGEAIAESLLIAQYLDHAGSGPALVPADRMAQVLARTSVGYGLMEAAFATMIARKHTGAAADASMLGQRRLAAMGRALRHLDQAPPACAGEAVTLDQLTVAVALEYVAFRLPELEWPTHHPALARWLGGMQTHPPLQSTAFA